MKKTFWTILVILIVSLVACSDDSEQHTNDSDMSEPAENESEESDNAVNNMESREAANNGENANAEGAADSGGEDPNRKVIYTANLEVEVENFQQSIQAIESSAEEMDGYVIESNRQENEEEESVNGQVTVRVPQESFQDFIASVEKESDKVLDSSTSGEDVTEEYVDLESRLASKEKVEKRLKTFMDEAEKTEDLLDISNDLESIQEDIENIKGQMEYLENKTDLSTVTIHLQEADTGISSTGKDDLNTWDKTKQQFMKSINFLITVFSSLFVFMAGNLPVFILIGVIALVVLFLIRKRNRENK